MGSRLKAMTQSCIGGKSHIVSNSRRYLVRRWQITAFPYQIRKQVMDTQRVVTALNNVGLSERTLHQPITELSGGERQRVALIRNILFLPKVLLLDEVTAGLDENNKQIVHAWLRQLNEQDHVTTIMITHDATEIAAADQLAKVVAGRLEVHA